MPRSYHKSLVRNHRNLTWINSRKGHSLIKHQAHPRVSAKTVYFSSRRWAWNRFARLSLKGASCGTMALRMRCTRSAGISCGAREWKMSRSMWNMITHSKARSNLIMSRAMRNLLECPREHSMTSPLGSNYLLSSRRGRPQATTLIWIGVHLSEPKVFFRMMASGWKSWSTPVIFSWAI